VGARSSLATAVLALALAGVAAAASLPGVITAHDRTAWRAILHWPSSCEQGWKATASPGAGMQVMKANGDRSLVAVECYPGAYQGDALLYLASPAAKPVGPLKLQVYEDPGNGHVKLKTATTILGVLDFTRSTGTLTVFDKFRGLGDCGVFSTYRLEGSRLVLTAARAKTACDGKPPFSTERWPKLPV
jgi:hypothetical protein